MTIARIRANRGDLGSLGEYVNRCEERPGTVNPGGYGGRTREKREVEREEEREKRMARARGCMDTSLRRWFVIL